MKRYKSVMNNLLHIFLVSVLTLIVSFWIPFVTLRPWSNIDNVIMYYWNRNCARYPRRGTTKLYDDFDPWYSLCEGSTSQTSRFSKQMVLVAFLPGRKDLLQFWCIIFAFKVSGEVPSHCRQREGLRVGLCRDDPCAMPKDLTTPGYIIWFLHISFRYSFGGTFSMNLKFHQKRYVLRRILIYWSTQLDDIAHLRYSIDLMIIDMFHVFTEAPLLENLTTGWIRDPRITILPPPRNRDLENFLRNTLEV